jgi:pimeloyl-ACP methyl ester carboxylesterase
MKETVAMRELFVLDDCGVILRGTYHKSYDDNASPRERVGVLFMNGLSAIRSAKGDSAVYWADSFAEYGYPSFRLDLPGYGDSDGDPPADQLGFINAGGFAAVARTAIDKMAARFNLAGVVIVGHCTGSVSAIYTAAATRKCKGLVLLDPYFHLPQTTASRLRRLLHVWALQSGVENVLIKFYDSARELLLSSRGNALPANANLSLLRCWKKTASSGFPILILKRSSPNAPGAKPRTGEFDYLKHVLELAGRKSRVEVRVTEGANHSFANRLGRATVREHTERWLNTYFPIANCRGRGVSAAHSKSIESNMTVETVSGM